MASRDEILLATLADLKWVVAGSGPVIRDEADMRAINAWIERAVDAKLLDPDSFEASMLAALSARMFTIATVADGEPSFELTEYGRARADSMPHDYKRLTSDGIRGEGDPHGQ